MNTAGIEATFARKLASNRASLIKLCVECDRPCTVDVVIDNATDGWIFRRYCHSCGRCAFKVVSYYDAVDDIDAVVERALSVLDGAWL